MQYLRQFLFLLAIGLLIAPSLAAPKGGSRGGSKGGTSTSSSKNKGGGSKSGTSSGSGSSKGAAAAVKPISQSPPKHNTPEATKPKTSAPIPLKPNPAPSTKKTTPSTKKTTTSSAKEPTIAPVQSSNTGPKSGTSIPSQTASPAKKTTTPPVKGSTIVSAKPSNTTPKSSTSMAAKLGAISAASTARTGNSMAHPAGTLLSPLSKVSVSASLTTSLASSLLKSSFITQNIPSISPSSQKTGVLHPISGKSSLLPSSAVESLKNALPTSATLQSPLTSIYPSKSSSIAELGGANFGDCGWAPGMRKGVKRQVNGCSYSKPESNPAKVTASKQSPQPSLLSDVPIKPKASLGSFTTEAFGISKSNIGTKTSAIDRPSVTALSSTSAVKHATTGQLGLSRLDTTRLPKTTTLDNLSGAMSTGPSASVPKASIYSTPTAVTTLATSVQAHQTGLYSSGSPFPESSGTAIRPGTTLSSATGLLTAFSSQSTLRTGTNTYSASASLTVPPLAPPKTTDPIYGAAPVNDPNQELGGSPIRESDSSLGSASQLQQGGALPGGGSQGPFSPNKNQDFNPEASALPDPGMVNPPLANTGPLNTPLPTNAAVQGGSDISGNAASPNGGSFNQAPAVPLNDQNVGAQPVNMDQYSSPPIVDPASFSSQNTPIQVFPNIPNNVPDLSGFSSNQGTGTSPIQQVGSDVLSNTMPPADEPIAAPNGDTATEPLPTSGGNTPNDSSTSHEVTGNEAITQNVDGFGAGGQPTQTTEAPVSSETSTSKPDVTQDTYSLEPTLEPGNSTTPETTTGSQEIAGSPNNTPSNVLQTADQTASSPNTAAYTDITNPSAIYPEGSGSSPDSTQTLQRRAPVHPRDFISVLERTL